MIVRSYIDYKFFFLQRDPDAVLELEFVFYDQKFHRINVRSTLGKCSTNIIMLECLSPALIKFKGTCIGRNGIPAMPSQVIGDPGDGFSKITGYGGGIKSEIIIFRIQKKCLTKIEIGNGRIIVQKIGKEFWAE